MHYQSILIFTFLYRRWVEKWFWVIKGIPRI
jgi:hypothetical protein